MLHAKAGKTVGAGLGVHQAERRQMGREELARVGFERHDPKRAMTPRKVDHRPVAPVDAVEIAHGDRGAAR